jgi:hypothetical protein
MISSLSDAMKIIAASAYIHWSKASKGLKNQQKTA